MSTVLLTLMLAAAGAVPVPVAGVVGGTPAVPEVRLRMHAAMLMLLFMHPILSVWTGYAELENRR